MNQYLEKIALNAAKARQMARQVGVIPDPDSAWKWALRNLRNGRGEPLQGRALAEKRVGLGDLSNNGYQFASSVEKHKTAPGQEFSASVDRIGNVGRDVNMGGIESVSMRNEDTLHNHPVTTNRAELRGDSPYKDDVYRKGAPHRLATPSLFSELEPTINRRSIQNTLDSIPKVKSSTRTNEKRIEKLKKLVLPKATSGPLDPRTRSRIMSINSRIQDRLNKNWTDLDRLDYSLNTTRLRRMQGDLVVFSDASKRGRPINRVVAPSANTVSVTKTYSNPYLRPRLTYFDHTPRKTKP